MNQLNRFLVTTFKVAVVVRWSGDQSVRHSVGSQSLTAISLYNSALYSERGGGHAG
ncbi:MULTISPECIES: hypothetical protein [Pseudomonas]|uniref:hypothetical protein n=1 Tax=Pseudomonas TaxID=286 RepID=UPI0013158A65|nr:MULTISPECIES: hypothetical protein [Pseudomonas]WRQ73555.1 hypothetical protein VQY67_15450 [Pseudomonas saxonica]